ncbi:MarR family winged helix-turn-helix transcriptional regulator [Rhodococcus sp. NPDC003318]|uniref:MarR family winged helix-turn-helix transcriptional regulator n=1 Tax=Rhodococcus sp. NPDC003318 TaxID=3364503 RepID=UPI0036D1C018
MTTTPDQLFRVLTDFITRLLCIGEGEAIDRLVGLDLSFSQVRTLFTLAQCDEPVAIHEIASRLHLSVAAAGRNVEQLLQQGLLDRREDPGDRRVRRISLSGAGHTLVAGHIEAQREEVRSFTERLPQSDRNQLFDSLQTVLAGDALRAQRHHSQETP